MSKVISAFPGCGKSTLFRNAEKMKLIPVPVSKDFDGNVTYTVPEIPEGYSPVFDSDSSLFNKEHFPQNYIEHIKKIIQDYPTATILVSSHDTVREALINAGIEFILIYPRLDAKHAFLNRYEARGSHSSFIAMMDDNWSKFIASCKETPVPQYEICFDQSVADVINGWVALVGSNELPKGKKIFIIKDAPTAKEIAKELKYHNSYRTCHPYIDRYGDVEYDLMAQPEEKGVITIISNDVIDNGHGVKDNLCNWLRTHLNWTGSRVAFLLPETESVLSQIQGDPIFKSVEVMTNCSDSYINEAITNHLDN